MFDRCFDAHPLQNTPRSSKVANASLGASGLLAPLGTTRVIGVRSAIGTVVAPLSPELIVSPGDVIIVQGEAPGYKLPAP